MTRLYVAGPMTGHPEFNYPSFNEAAANLTARGYEVLNPARHGIVEGWTWHDYMRHALRDVTHADGIAVLPLWHSSRGARLEVHVAQALGLPVRDVARWMEGRPC